ncbi:MAG: Ldh family oxidoreductase [SAR202 cluster bacterium]|nr:Ldh family oxidoreductase [SAR202 cluster bacterium]
MLKPFQTREEDWVRVSHESLRGTIHAVFRKIGLSEEDCAILADCIVATDLLGVETHGASTAVRAYVDRYRAGSCNLRPQPRIVRQTPGTAVIDGDNGLGAIQSVKAMRMAIEKARTVGIGVVTAFNCGNTGAIGTYAELAARENMVGLCMSGAGGRDGVLPTGAAEGRLGTTPIAFAAPAGEEPRFLFDVATSAVAGGKLNLAKRLGTNILPGWIADANGVPIMKEGPIPSGKYFRIPLGSTRELGSHKGYGLSVMVVITGAMLAGQGSGMDGEDVGSCHHFVAYNIEEFTDVATFKKNMDVMLRALRETRPAPGFDRVVYAVLQAY